MDCNETRRLLEADLDGELDLVRHLELETHLRGCTECARIAETLRGRRSERRMALPRFTAPSSLMRKIGASLRAETAPIPAVPERKKLIPFGAAWSALAASLIVALGVGYSVGSTRARSNLLFEEAISEHVRSLQTGHLTDVVSSDQHTVKPWFVGKLDFSPPVVDLAAAGFPLAGGRLDYLDGRTAAALVFHRREHPIVVFVWPARSGDVSAHHLERMGYAAQAWNRGDLNFLAVSEIPSDELAEFIAAFRRATP